MNHDQLRRSAAIAEELFAHLRGRDAVFPELHRAQATYDTTFHGYFRVEVGVAAGAGVDRGTACRLAIERVGGDRVFDWTMAEFERRHPSPKRRADLEPSQPPYPDEVEYRLEVTDLDRAKGAMLLDELRALDWAEATPEGNAGRDGVSVSGALSTEDGGRSWVTWSPDPAIEPAKSAFFERLLRFAIDNSDGSVRDDLVLVRLR